MAEGAVETLKYELLSSERHLEHDRQYARELRADLEKVTVRIAAFEQHIADCKAALSKLDSHEHEWSLPVGAGVYRCMTCGIETTDLNAGV